MKMKITWTPEAAPERQWVVDRDNPTWDLIYATEKATDWAWLEFLGRLDAFSGIAWRALLWALRKRDEQRLRLEWVEIDDWSKLGLEIQCPACEEWTLAQSEHLCTFPEPEADEPEDAEAAEAGDVDPEA